MGILIKQGAELVATRENVWEDLPAAVRLVLARPAGDESGRPSSASLFPDEGLPPYEKPILGLLKADQASQIDEIVEQLETEMSPSEILRCALHWSWREKCGRCRGGIL